MPLVWAAVALLLPVALIATGCYNNNTGDAEVPGIARFKLPAFPETGGNVVEVFTEMHYQQSFRSQETPRLLPPPESVPVTGRETRFATAKEYAALTVPGNIRKAYDPARGQKLFRVNCVVCHGAGMDGNGAVVKFMGRGPFPADLTAPQTRESTDGDLFSFITFGGRQGAATRLRGLESPSIMPEFGRLLTEGERWQLVLFLRSRIGG